MTNNKKNTTTTITTPFFYYHTNSSFGPKTSIHTKLLTKSGIIDSNIIMLSSTHFWRSRSLPHTFREGNCSLFIFAGGRRFGTAKQNGMTFISWKREIPKDIEC